MGFRSGAQSWCRSGAVARSLAAQLYYSTFLHRPNFRLPLNYVRLVLHVHSFHVFRKHHVGHVGIYAILSVVVLSRSEANFEAD
jgi:hypothetical protein